MQIVYFENNLFFRPGDTFRAMQAGQTPVDKAKMDSEVSL